MTWEELKEKAKEMGADVFDNGGIYFGHLRFEEDGTIYVDPAHYDWEELGETITIASDRTYDEMLMIMRGLE